MKVQIKGHEWTIILSPEPLDQCRAFTDLDEKSITFYKKDFTPRVILHEVFHAYCGSLHLASSQIHWVDFEEIIAEMLEEEIVNILATTREVLRLGKYRKPKKITLADASILTQLVNKS
jgi:hypothetical protein